MSIKDYELIQEIGRGAFGTVYKATRTDGKVIALKVIDIPAIEPVKKEKLIELTKKEVEYLKTLSLPQCNPFTICYYDSHYDSEKGQFLIEMEYVEGKDLGEFIKELKTIKSPEMINYYILAIAKDISEGLKYIHSKNIIHNDIKLENIIIDESNTPRIIDFGLACTMSFNTLIGKYCRANGGTPWYLSPESVESKIKTPAVDMWALGMLLYRLATGKFPYTLRRQLIPELFQKIKNTEPYILETDNKQLNTVVNNLLVRNIMNRWKTNDVLIELRTISKPEEM